MLKRVESAIAGVHFLAYSPLGWRDLARPGPASQQPTTHSATLAQHPLEGNTKIQGKSCAAWAALFPKAFHRYNELWLTAATKCVSRTSWTRATGAAQDIGLQARKLYLGLQ